MVPPRTKNGTWEMSGWPFFLAQQPFGARHWPPACHPGAWGCVLTPAVSRSVLGMQVVCPEQCCPQRKGMAQHWRNDTGSVMWPIGEPAPWRNGWLWKQSLNLCPATLHLTGLDQSLDWFKTWFSHMLNGDNGAILLEFWWSYARPSHEKPSTVLSKS